MKKCFVLAMVLSAVLALVACESPLPCCLSPKYINKDYFIQKYIISSDTFNVLSSFRKLENDGFWHWIGDSSSRTKMLSRNVRMEVDFDLYGAIVRSPETQERPPTQYIYHTMSKSEETSLFDSLARAYGDTLFFGKHVEDGVPSILVDPVKSISIRSNIPYRDHANMDTLIGFSKRIFPGNILEIENFTLDSEYDVESYPKGIYRFDESLYKRLEGKTYLFNSLLGHVDFQSHSISFYLETPPYKSGNYEFEITATTKSGKVLKTKTEPIYLVGENE